jgi:hypothetical protein
MTKVLVDIMDLNLILSNVHTNGDLNLMQAIGRCLKTVSNKNSPKITALYLSCNPANEIPNFFSKVQMVKLIKDLNMGKDDHGNLKSSIGLREAKEFADTCMDNFKSVILFKNDIDLQVFKSTFDLSKVQYEFKRVNKPQTALNTLYPHLAKLYWTP